jgi:hypothetical protein
LVYLVNISIEAHAALAPGIAQKMVVVFPVYVMGIMKKVQKHLTEP